MKVESPGETILLVEDDPPVRDIISLLLQGQGYQLLEARNGLEASRLAANHRGPIDLLLTDIVMPHMDGFTLVTRLVESHPEIRVLFMSGNVDRSESVRVELQGAGHTFLLKPFTCDRLLRTVREQLDTKPGRSPVV